jgi:hypothetical protein
MGIGSDPAGTLHKVVGIARIASLKNHFNTAEHLARTPGIDHLSAFNLHLNPEVAFYSRYWINYNALAH